MWNGDTLDNGALLDPATIAGRRHAAAVWTGDELVVWGGARGEAFADGRPGAWTGCERPAR